MWICQSKIENCFVLKTDRLLVGQLYTTQQTNNMSEYKIYDIGFPRGNMNSGYRSFIKAKMPEIKKKPNIPAKDRLTVIGAMWKELTNEEKVRWEN